MNAAISLLLGLVVALGTLDPTPPVSGSAEPDAFVVGSAKNAEAHHALPSAKTAHEPSTPTIVLGANACAAADPLADQLLGASEVSYCPGSEPAHPTLTLADIRHAFAELRLPAADLVVQPPGGLTLVNFATNFYTPRTQPITRTVTLLGQRVTIRATPSAYTWAYGDGASRTTSDPGAPYPDLRITHDYRRRGSYRASLAVTYTGAFRLGASGPWRTIPGTVTRPGPARLVRAVEATPTLVGY